MHLSRSPITRRTAAALAFSAPLGVAAAAVAALDDDKARRPASAKGPKAGPGSLESWWEDLEKPEVEATRALLNMADRRQETVAFLEAKMKPLKITAGEVRALLLKLGNENEKVWKPAAEELEYFDPRLAIDLETLMDRYKEAPGRQRLVEVLSGRPDGSLAGKEVHLRKHGDFYNFFTANLSWWAEHKVERINAPEGWGNMRKKWSRAARAIVMLEHFGTPAAVAILKDMATGHPDAQPTRVAKDALARLGETRKTP
jgi:hypothetical protein